MATVGYLRVSTDKLSRTPKTKSLRSLSTRTPSTSGIGAWVGSKASSRRFPKERKIDELLEQLREGDILIVAELSRLDRTVGQIAILVDELLKKKVRVVCLKENINLNGRADIPTKVMVTMFSPFAEIERDLISERTKKGLSRARAEGKLLGRPKGSIGKSKLDGKE